MLAEFNFCEKIIQKKEEQWNSFWGEVKNDRYIFGSVGEYLIRLDTHHHKEPLTSSDHEYLGSVIFPENQEQKAGTTEGYHCH